MMIDDELQDTLLSQIIEAPQNREAILESANLSPQDRLTLSALADTVDSLWLAAHGAPPLLDDPVAALLGLVPDSRRSLAPRELTNVRKQARVSVSQLAARLQERGWQYDTRDVFAWEGARSNDVPPAVIEDLASILKVSTGALTRVIADMRPTDVVIEVRREPRFQELATRWAEIKNVSLDIARAALERRMVMTVHRGEHPNPNQVLSALESLIDAMEQEE